MGCLLGSENSGRQNLASNHNREPRARPVCGCSLVQDVGYFRLGIRRSRNWPQAQSAGPGNYRSECRTSPGLWERTSSGSFEMGWHNRRHALSEVAGRHLRNFSTAFHGRPAGCDQRETNRRDTEPAATVSRSLHAARADPRRRFRRRARTISVESNPGSDGYGFRRLWAFGRIGLSL